MRLGAGDSLVDSVLRILRQSWILEPRAQDSGQKVEEAASPLHHAVLLVHISGELKQKVEVYGLF